MSADLVALLYLLAAVLFILALRGLSNPETSRRGNLFGMVGMAIAIVTTLASHPPEGAGAWALVIVGIAIGGTVGAVIARRVPDDGHAGARRGIPFARRNGGSAGGGCRTLRAGGLRHRG